MGFREKFHFRDGKVLEVSVQEKLNVLKFEGVLEILDEGKGIIIINLSQVMFVELMQEIEK